MGVNFSPYYQNRFYPNRFPLNGGPVRTLKAFNNQHDSAARNRLGEVLHRMDKDPLGCQLLSGAMRHGYHIQFFSKTPEPIPAAGGSPMQVVNGNTDVNGKNIQVNPALPFNDLIGTIAHECLHANTDEATPLNHGQTNSILEEALGNWMKQTELIRLRLPVTYKSPASLLQEAIVKYQAQGLPLDNNIGPEGIQAGFRPEIRSFFARLDPSALAGMGLRMAPNGLGVQSG